MMKRYYKKNATATERLEASAKKQPLSAMNSPVPRAEKHGVAKSSRKPAQPVPAPGGIDFEKYLKSAVKLAMKEQTRARTQRPRHQTAKRARRGEDDDDEDDDDEDDDVDYDENEDESEDDEDESEDDETDDTDGEDDDGEGRVSRRPARRRPAAKRRAGAGQPRQRSTPRSIAEGAHTRIGQDLARLRLSPSQFAYVGSRPGPGQVVHPAEWLSKYKAKRMLTFLNCPTDHMYLSDTQLKQVVHGIIQARIMKQIAEIGRQRHMAPALKLMQEPSGYRGHILPKQATLALGQAVQLIREQNVPLKGQFEGMHMSKEVRACVADEIAKRIDELGEGAFKLGSGIATRNVHIVDEAVREAVFYTNTPRGQRELQNLASELIAAWMSLYCSDDALDSQVARHVAGRLSSDAGLRAHYAKLSDEDIAACQTDPPPQKAVRSVLVQVQNELVRIASRCMENSVNLKSASLLDAAALRGVFYADDGQAHTMQQELLHWARRGVVEGTKSFRDVVAAKTARWEEEANGKAANGKKNRKPNMRDRLAIREEAEKELDDRERVRGMFEHELAPLREGVQNPVLLLMLGSNFRVPDGPVQVDNLVKGAADLVERLFRDSYNTSTARFSEKIESLKFGNAASKPKTTDIGAMGASYKKGQVRTDLARFALPFFTFCTMDAEKDFMSPLTEFFCVCWLTALGARATHIGLVDATYTYVGDDKLIDAKTRATNRTSKKRQYKLVHSSV